MYWRQWRIVPPSLVTVQDVWSVGFTTLAKLSVDVSDVVSHKLSRNGLSEAYQALN